MISKIKTILLSAFFMLSAAISIHAQEKYEYAVMTYVPYAKLLEVSINGTEYKKIEVPKEKVKSHGDVNAALEEVNKMVENDWELFDTGFSNGSGLHTYAFFLRRKK